MLFKDNYAFLSNFYTTPVRVIIDKKELIFRNAEAAFQAHKNKSLADKFCLLTGNEAKQYGQKIPLDVSVEEWDDLRYYVMAKVLWSKFQNKELFEKLQEVKEPIVEDNYWNDTFWGVCTNKKYKHEGHNILGRLLTFLRDNGNTVEGLELLYKFCDEIKNDYKKSVL